MNILGSAVCEAVWLKLHIIRFKRVTKGQNTNKRNPSFQHKKCNKITQKYHAI